MNSTNVEVQYAPHVQVYRTRLTAPVWHGRVWDITLTIALLCVSGNLTFSLGRTAERAPGTETAYAAAAVLLAFALLLRPELRSRAVRAFVPVAGIFAALSIVHAYTFDFFPVVTVMGFLTRLFIGMAVVILVSDFVHAYVVTMVGLSALSFLFWVPEYITSLSGSPFHNLFKTLASHLGRQPVDRLSLGFHTFLTDPQQMHRNAGMFWEPGVFAGYIIIALLMLAALRPSLTHNRHLAALGVLTLTLLTTFSTAGYIAYPIALLLNCNWRGISWRNRSPSILGIGFITVIVLIGSVHAFTYLDFLQPKIQAQLEAVERREHGWEINRFGTLVFDWNCISQRPFTGWGLNSRTRFALDPWASENEFGNGMSNFIANFGIIGFGTFLVSFARGAQHIGGQSRGYVVGFLAATLVVLQGEPFLGFPLFLGLMFLSYASVRPQRLVQVRSVESGFSMPAHYCAYLQTPKP